MSLNTQDEHDVQGAVLKEISGRKALRSLGTGKITRKIIGTLVEAASLAPSCFNKQPWRFIAADEPAVLDKVFEALTDANYWARRSTAVIVVVTDVSFDCALSDRRDYALFDTGLAVMNIMLQAEHMGLIAHPLAGFDPLKIKEHFKLPESHIVIALLALGFKGGSKDHLNEKHLEHETGPRVRRPAEEMLFYNSFIKQ